MKNVLIIGKNSYIGTYLQKYLSSLDTFCVSMVSAKNKEYESIDYSQYDAVIMASAIVHKKNVPEEIYRVVNYELSCHIFDMCKVAGIKQFIFFSTMSVYGNETESITPETEVHPNTYYAMYKYKAEQYMRSCQQNSMTVTILRPPMVYGEGCPGNYATLEKYAKYFLLFPKLENKRSAIHIDILCQYVYELLRTEKEGIFFPQDEDYLCTYRVIVELRKAKGKPTYTVSCFNGILHWLMPHIPLVKKIFGSLYYDRNRLK